MMQQKIRRNILLIFLSIMIVLQNKMCYAKAILPAVKIRVAILDNFTVEKAPQKYKDAYFSGIDAAVFAAKKKGYDVQYKIFSYGNNPLDIFNSVIDVKAWNPDFIVGPHSSNQYLLLKNYFKDVLVISPYATDELVNKMPGNFYCLSLSDNYMARANIAFIERYFPGRNIFNITQADCKDCVDMTLLFNHMYKNKHPSLKIVDRFYSGRDVERLDMHSLVSGYSEGSVIILQPLSYSDAKVLMERVLRVVDDKSVVFINNLDKWDDLTEVNKINGPFHSYSSFRISPVIENHRSVLFKEYDAYCKSKLNVYCNQSLSYMTYSSVMSVIEALRFSPVVGEKNMKMMILASYIDIRKKNPYWYRPASFMVYAMELQGETEKEIIINFNPKK